jgi:predicted RNA-binding Zn ribbon-like protein
MNDGVAGEGMSVALSLVNTIRMSRDGEVDLLADPAAHTRWFLERSLTRHHLRVGPHEIARLAELRAAVRALFLAVIDGSRPPVRALNTINAASGLKAVVATLTWTADGPRREFTSGPQRGIEAVLATVATDAIDVAASELGARLRRCQAPGCVGIYLQNHGRRVWCSTPCGDRVRAARHYKTVQRERSLGVDR